MLTTLRRNLPTAHIGWLVEGSYTPLLDSHPDLDEVIPTGLRAWRRDLLARATWRQLRNFLQRLESFRPDVVLDLMGNHKSGVLAALTMCDRRIGLERRYRREPSSAVWISESVRPTGSHAVDQMLSLLTPFDLDDRRVDFGADKLRQALGIGPAARTSEPQVIVHPGAGWVIKRYPADQWGQVARLIATRTGLRTTVISSPAEEELATTIKRTSDGAAREVSAPDLPSLASVLDGASLVMGGDTGPIHLAHALDRPVLCLMGPTDPARNGPYGAAENVLWHPLPCSFCHKRYKTPQKCMLDLTPEIVAERAISLLPHDPKER